ncbi:unnamed protein product, partial [Musa hybrid cultivar]
MTKMSPTLLHCRRSSASISTPRTLFTLFSSDRNPRHGASDPSTASSSPSSRTSVAAAAASALPLLRRHSPPPPPVRHPPGRPRRPPLHLPASAEILEFFLIQAPAGPPTLKRGPDYPSCNVHLISYMQMKGYETWKAEKSRTSSSAEHEVISAEPEKSMQLHILSC